MSKISLSLGERKVYEFDEQKQKEYGNFTSYVITQIVKGLVALSGFMLIFSVVFKDYSFYNNWLFVFAVVAALLTIIKQVISDRLFKSRPTVSLTLLITTLVFLVISFLLSNSETNLESPTIFLNYQSLLGLVLLAISFKLNYSKKVVKFLFFSLTAGVSLVVLADSFAIVRFLTTSERIDVSFLSFEMYVITLVVYYCILKIKLKFYLKIGAYILGLLTLVLLAYSLTSVGKFWVIYLSIILSTLTLVVLNFSKIKLFLSKTINYFKEKKYLSFSLNILFTLLILVLVGIAVWIGATRLDYRVITSIFTDFWSNLTTPFAPISIVSNSGTIPTNALTDSVFTIVGLNMGLTVLLSLTLLMLYMFVAVVKKIPVFYEVLIFVILFSFFQTTVLSVNLSILFLLPFLYLAVNKSVSLRNRKVEVKKFNEGEVVNKKNKNHKKK